MVVLLPPVTVRLWPCVSSPVTPFEPLPSTNNRRRILGELKRVCRGVELRRKTCREEGDAT
jgi:hypothetical protein